MDIYYRAKERNPKKWPNIYVKFYWQDKSRKYPFMYKKKTPWEQRRIRRDIVQISAVQTFRSIARLQYYQN